MLRVVLWHDEGDSRSQRALDVLRKTVADNKNVEVIARPIGRQPPSAHELQRVLDALGMRAGELVNPKHPKAKELAATDAGAAMLAMCQDPTLIAGPVALREDPVRPTEPYVPTEHTAPPPPPSEMRAVQCRPPIKILTLLAPIGLPPHVSELIKQQNAGSSG